MLSDGASLSFGIKTSQAGLSYEEILRVWREADQVPEFQHAWLWDHLVPLRGDVTGAALEAWTLLAALAAQTSRLRLGVIVTSNRIRPPAVLAKMAATVDVIAAGRLVFGIGAGGSADQRPGARAAGAPGVRRVRDRRGDGRRGAGRAGRDLHAGQAAVERGRAVRLRRALLSAQRRGLRAEAGPAPASADHDRVGRRTARSSDRRRARRHLVEPHLHRRGLPPQERHPRRPLRRHRARPSRDHPFGAGLFHRAGTVVSNCAPPRAGRRPRTAGRADRAGARHCVLACIGMPSVRGWPTRSSTPSARWRAWRLLSPGAGSGCMLTWSRADRRGEQAAKPSARGRVPVRPPRRGSRRGRPGPPSGRRGR